MNFILIYLSGIVCLAIIPVSGYLILRRVSFALKPGALFFLRCFVGLLVWVSLYSIWKTNGITFNIAILAFLIFLFVGKKSDTEKSPPLQYRYILIGLFFFSFCFILKCFSFYNFSAHLPNIPHNDVLFYTTVSDFIGQTGQENIENFRNVVDSSVHGLFPYHFFELWMNSFLSTAFHHNSLWTFELLTHPLLLTFVALGFYALMEELTNGRSSIFLIMASLGWLFFAGLSIDFPKMNIAPMNGVLYPKLLGIYLFILASSLFFISRQFWFSVATLLVLAWTNTAAAPGIYMGLFLYGSLMLLRYDKLSGWKIIIVTVISAVVYLTCFVVFKTRQDSFASGMVVINTMLGAAKTWTVQLIMMVLNYSIVIGVLFWLILGKRFSLKFKMENPDIARLLQLLFLIVISGWVFSGVTISIVSSQFAYNLYVPVLTLVIIVLSSLLIEGALKNEVFLGMGLLLLVLTYNIYFTFESSLFSKSSRVNRYSRGFVETTGKAIQGLEKPLGLFIADQSFFERSDLNKSEDNHYPSKYLKSWRSGLFLVNYYPDQIMDSVSGMSRMYIRNCVLYSFARQKHLPISNLNTSRLQFVHAFRPGFLLIQGSGFPPVELRKYVTDSVHDSRSGEKMYILTY